jgi:hypothetical protein
MDNSVVDEKYKIYEYQVGGPHSDVKIRRWQPCSEKDIKKERVRILHASTIPPCHPSALPPHPISAQMLQIILERA